MQKPQEKPIGIFDSGLGGLSVLKKLTKILPNENIVYLGDTARVPYGSRGAETIRRFSEEDTKFLVNKKVKAVIIACNTSSAVAADYIKRKFKKVPIFEVISSAAKEASSKGKIVGVIGTYGTVNSLAYTKKIKKYSPKIKVIEKACPLFVPFIEEGETNSKALKIIAGEYLTGFSKAKIDTLILGCTHYPIIKNIIGAAVGKKVSLIDPGVSIAIDVKKYLTESNLLNGSQKSDIVNYYVTDITDRFAKVAEMFLGRRIKNRLQKVAI